MPRTQPDILNSLIQTIGNTDPSMDVKVGPVYDYLLAPLPPELSTLESAVQRLLLFYSDQFPTAATSDEILAFARQFGVAPDVGAFAHVPVIFFRNSVPLAATEYLVPLGTVIGTADFTLLYRTIEEKSIRGDYAETYYNPSRRRYELEILCEAVTPGTQYNIPPSRIRRFNSDVPGFDGVDQQIAATGGAEPEDTTLLATRVATNFRGLDQFSIEGVRSTVLNYGKSTVMDVHIIRPTDRQEFRRPTTKPAFDICIAGSDPISFIEEHIAVGGEYSIELRNASVMSISSIAVNGTALDPATDYQLVMDTSPEYRGSTRASNKVEFTTALIQNDYVEIQGVRNKLLDLVQALFSPDSNQMFETDVLARTFVDVPVVVGMEVRVVALDNNPATLTTDDITNMVASYINNENVPASLDAATLSSFMKSVTSGIQSVRIYEFRRLYGSIDKIETIYLLKNEKPTYASTASNIVVRT